MKLGAKSRVSGPALKMRIWGGWIIRSSNKMFTANLNCFLGLDKKIHDPQGGLACRM